MKKEKERKWSREEVEKGIRQLFRKTGRPLNWEEAWKVAPALVMAAYRTHGGWRLAVEAAGFKYPGNYKYRIKKIREKGLAMLPEILATLDPQHRAGVIALLKEFGLWGSNGPNDPQIVAALWEKKWKAKANLSPEGVLEFIRHLPDKGYNKVRKQHPWLLREAVRIFGSWGAAVQAAGFDYKFRFPGGRRRQLKYSPRFLLKRLAELTAKPARERTEEEKKELNRLRLAAYYHFGTSSLKKKQKRQI